MRAIISFARMARSYDRGMILPYHRGQARSYDRGVI